MSSTYALRSVNHLRTGEHFCLLYDSEQQHRDAVRPFLSAGIKSNEKILYLYDSHAPDEITGYLRAQGERVDPCLESGQLQLRSAKNIFVRKGAFLPDDPLSFFWHETQKALAEGYKGLRACCEMSWVKSDSPGIERLFEYEAKLNTFIPGSWCVLMCQYDRRRFTPVELLEVLATHPTVVVGTEVYENSYYVPPADSLGSDPLAATLRYRLANLAGRKSAEETLTERERKYRELFENSLEGIFQSSPEGRYLSVNPALAKMYGYASPEELIRSIEDIGAQVYADPKRRAEFVESLHGRDSVQGFESQLLRKDGSTLWVSENVRAVRDAAGALQHYEGTVHDITERKRQAKRVAAQHSAARVLAAANSLSEASRLILQSICESLEWELGALWTIDNAAQLMRCVEVWNRPEIEISDFLAITRETTFARGVGLPGRVWAKGEPAWIDDVVRDENFPRAPFAAKTGLHGAFAFPVVIRGEVLGAIEFFTREVQSPDEDLLKMMATIGSQIGQFIERKRAERELELTREALDESQRKKETA